jgi:hypothetical protein
MKGSSEHCMICFCESVPILFAFVVPIFQQAPMFGALLVLQFIDITELTRKPFGIPSNRVEKGLVRG